jgi:hypothetical protein
MYVPRFPGRLPPPSTLTGPTGQAARRQAGKNAQQVIEGVQGVDLLMNGAMPQSGSQQLQIWLADIHTCWFSGPRAAAQCSSEPGWTPQHAKSSWQHQQSAINNFVNARPRPQGTTTESTRAMHTQHNTTHAAVKSTTQTCAVAVVAVSKPALQPLASSAAAVVVAETSEQSPSKTCEVYTQHTHQQQQWVCQAAHTAGRALTWGRSTAVLLCPVILRLLLLLDGSLCVRLVCDGLQLKAQHSAAQHSTRRRRTRATCPKLFSYLCSCTFDSAGFHCTHTLQHSPCLM